MAERRPLLTLVPAAALRHIHGFAATGTEGMGEGAEDLFVRPAHRGEGIGRALIATVAGGCGRLEWSVLERNTPAIGFYRALGAEAMDQWTTFRLAGPALERLGGHA